MLTLTYAAVLTCAVLFPVAGTGLLILASQLVSHGMDQLLGCRE